MTALTIEWRGPTLQPSHRLQYKHDCKVRPRRLKFTNVFFDPEVSPYAALFVWKIKIKSRSLHVDRFSRVICVTKVLPETTLDDCLNHRTAWPHFAALSSSPIRT
jgi:hypothetical protein